MGSPAAETAAARLPRARQFALHSLALALTSLIVTTLAWFELRSAFVPLVVLTCGEGLVAICAFYWRLDLLQTVAADPSMQMNPDVRIYCRRLAQQSTRQRLARSIDSILRDAATPGSFVLRERTALVEDQLRAVACQLASPDVPVETRSVIMCIRLLTRGVESPLFNARVPVEELYSVLYRIRHGMGRPAAA
jgi:hypothetical protein